MAKKGGTRGARRMAVEPVDSESVETIHGNVEMAVEPSAEDIAAATSMGLERVGTGAKNEIPEVGAVVRCRTRTYQVDAVESADDAVGGTVVRMFCIDDDAEGRKLDVVWEHEIDTRILDRESWETLGAKGFDAPRFFAAYYRTLQWNCVTTTDKKFFQAPFRAGIKIDLYQLEPLRKALLLPRVNLFIADDVGLGKTIEAGLIARELLLRKRVESIIVVCPPSVIDQWQDEMTQRFGLRFEILDKAYFQRVREDRGFGVNPWETYPYILISERLLIDDTYKAPLIASLGAFSPKTLLIIDEAHHAAPASGAKYAIDSDFTRAIRDIAPRFEHRLFLSATPHNGHTNSFSALLQILDRNRFIRGTPVDRHNRDQVMVRRIKDQIRRLCGGFPERKLEQIDLKDLPPETPELRLSELFAQYKKVLQKRTASAGARSKSQTNLVLSGLQQRLLSSIEAFASTLKKHRNGMEKLWKGESLPAETKVSRRALSGSYDADDEEGALDEAEIAAIEDHAFESATRAAGAASPTADVAEERRLLDALRDLADQTRHRPDERIKWLVRWIREHLSPGARLPGEEVSYDQIGWTDERVIIFTEYEDTRRYIENALRAAVAHTDRADDRIATLRGATPRERRILLKRAFNSPPDEHPLRILICTESAREGINLQNHCTKLLHFDVPWNPARLEQRNGRIDRKGQPAPVVWCRYFFYTQRKEDPVLSAIVRKSENIHLELGGRYKVVEQRLAEKLAAGIDHDDIQPTLFEIEHAGKDAARDAVRREELDDAASLEKLEAELERLRPLLQESRERIRFTPEALEETVSAALEIVAGKRLEPTGDSASGKRTYPANECLAAGGASWDDALDTLRKAAPIEETTPPQFRRRQRAAEAKAGYGREILPVVFREKKDPDEQVVQLHLEHPVVQRLLGRFRAQGFRHHDLSRACLTTTNTAFPYVLLFGRLSLFGAGAARLHEEMIVTAAQWSAEASKNGKLKPEGVRKTKEILKLFEAAIADSKAPPVPTVVEDRFKSSIARDGRFLKTHLEATAKKAREEAEHLLEKRGEAESKAIRDAIEKQRERATSFVAANVEEDLWLPGMPQDEVRQKRLDIKACQRYIEESAKDLEEEPERIRNFYRVRTYRIEPVGLVYLHPVTG